MEHKTGLEDYYVIRGQKKMRFGYTTGSCAAAACKGACLMLLGKEKLTSVPLMTPKGILLDLEPVSYTHLHFLNIESEYMPFFPTKTGKKQSVISVSHGGINAKVSFFYMQMCIRDRLYCVMKFSFP